MAAESKSKNTRNVDESTLSDPLGGYSVGVALLKLVEKKKNDFERKLDKELELRIKEISGFVKSNPLDGGIYVDKYVSSNGNMSEDALLILADLYNVESAINEKITGAPFIKFGPSLDDEIIKTTKRLKELESRKRSREECMVDKDRVPKPRTDNVD
jgi:hypothetical protein